MTEWHPAAEEYCEAIFELGEDDITVVQARIVERLQVSRPAVSEMVRKLQRDGLVTVDGTLIELTRAGEALAQRVVRRHRLAERLLTDILHLPWAEAHHEAGKWEHVISDTVEAAMVKVLGDPTTCPHGNPIPGSSYESEEMVPLSSIASGAEFTVLRIPEELEFTPGTLEFLEAVNLVPGISGTVVNRAGTAMTLKMADETVRIDEFTAQRVLVSA